MLTPCKSLEYEQNDLSADEDMLENTKPNLISFSLSTSSSNQTVSVTTNSGRRVVEVESSSGCGETGVEKSTFEVLKGSGQIELPTFDVSLTSVVAELPAAPIISSNRGRRSSSKLFSEEAFTKPEVFQDDVSINNASAITQATVRTSTSLCNLFDVNSPHNDMPRFASHPQLSINQESKRSILTRSLSSITLKHRCHSYDHVESKVKHYIKQLKREKADTCEQMRQSEVNVLSPEEDSVVIELQQQIKRLQSYLEERDLLLQEVQANYHSLLLQYGEAKNKLDQLRFNSVKPQLAAKSIQTQSHSKTHDTSLVESYKDDKCIVLEKSVHEAENYISSSNDAVLNLIVDKKEQKQSFQSFQNTDLSDFECCKLDFEAKENELSLEKSTSYSAEMATQKVSSWFSTVPWPLLPVPSCYGSLGSSGGVSLQQQDNVPADPAADDEEEPQSPVEQPERLWNESCSSRGKWPGERSATKGGQGRCFLPIDKGYCWASNDIQNCVPLAGPTQAETKPASLEGVFGVPPLDLENLNKGSMPQDSCISENPFLSEDTLTSICSQHGSFSQKYPFKQTALDNKMYCETPTSYKSIMINCGRVMEAETYDKSNASISLPRDPQSGGKNGLYLKSTNIQRNHMESNWQRKHYQRPCCLEKIMRRCCCIVDSQVCCCWAKTSNHQSLRCKQCPSKDPVVPSDSQVLLDLEQFLGNMSACAEGLRKRSEDIQSFLTRLLNTHS